MGRSNRIRPEKLGEKLKFIRESLGLTQEQLIEKLRYSKSKLYPQNISGFENSEREPNLLILLAYARLIDISTDALIDDEIDISEGNKSYK
jgi:transcriptional regulator with XRE-family HTH domain